MSYHIGLAKMNSHAAAAGEHRLRPAPAGLHRTEVARSATTSSPADVDDNDKTSYGSLAEKYMQEGRLDQVERVLKQTLEIGEMVFGTTDSRIEHSVQELAAFYWSHAQYKQAEPLLERLVEIRVRTLHMFDPLMLSTIDQLAEVYLYRDKVFRAELLYKALLKRQWKHGDEQLNLGAITTLKKLANVYYRQQDYSAAESGYLRALSMQEIAFGAYDTELKETLKSLATVYNAQGKYPLAAFALTRMLSILERVEAESSISIASCLTMLADVYTRMDRKLDGEPYYHRALAIYTQAKGEHRKIISALTHKIGALYGKPRLDLTAAQPRLAQSQTVQDVVVHWSELLHERPVESRA
jgi:tetratricopeptide (TPR) repeat protein